MNDPMYEKCEKCKHGKLVRDNHDEFHICELHKMPFECSLIDEVKPIVHLVACTPNAMKVIEQAASICYNSKPTEKFRIAKACYASGHTSVFEHASFTFEISGVSRAFLAQITRHRIASFSVRSQRYCKEDGFHFIVPRTVKSHAETDLYNDAMESMRDAYEMLIEAEIPAEDARFVLPNACETRMIVTMNARELISFCGLRLCKRAQWEIRAITQLMVEAVRTVEPELANLLRPNCERYYPNCFCTERESCGRHPTLAEVFKKYNE